MKHVLDDKTMAPLGEDQKVAVMEALLLGLLADGRATPPEIARFDEAVDRIPWGLTREALVSKFEAVRSRIIELGRAHDRPALLAMVTDVARRLPAPDLREKVFRTMTALMGAGEALNVGEKNMMIAFATAFDLTVERLDAIKADMIAAGD